MQLLNYEVWIASSDICKTGVFTHFARNVLTSVTVRNGVHREDSSIKCHKQIRVSWLVAFKCVFKRLLFALVLDSRESNVHQWNYTDRCSPKHREENLFYWHCIYHRSLTDRPGTKLGYPCPSVGVLRYDQIILTSYFLNVVHSENIECNGDLKSSMKISVKETRKCLQFS